MWIDDRVVVIEAMADAARPDVDGKGVGRSCTERVIAGRNRRSALMVMRDADLRICSIFTLLGSYNGSVLKRKSSLMAAIPMDRARIAGFCERNHIRKLSLFGSVLRGELRPDSDIDVLVEFVPGRGPGFLRLFELEEELSRLFGGRKIDMVTEKFLNRWIRDHVLSEAEVQYVER